MNKQGSKEALLFDKNVEHDLVIVIKIFSLCLSGDVIVSLDMYQKQHYRWSITIILLMLIPNLVFILWMLLGSMRKLKTRDTAARVTAGGCIQGLTITR